jgi:hypothetical protein
VPPPLGGLVLTELSFRVEGRDNILCQFTQVHPDATIVINPLRSDPDARIERALYTIHADPDHAWELIEGHFDDAYGGYELIAGRDEAVTVEVPFRLPTVGDHGDPLHLALSALGSDAFFLPLVVQEGYIHCTLVSTSSEDTQAFVELTKQVNRHLDPEAFDLLNVGPWDPVPGKPKDLDLTSRQQDVLQMAAALGYYSRPRETTLEELGEILGVSKAAVHKTLSAAENKVIKDALGAR